MAAAPALRAALRKPVDLVDGEWTSWYGVRAIDGLRALASYRSGPSFTSRGVG